MGSVYLAEETALGRKVAVKVVSDRIERTTGAISRLRREARAMATLEHPNIVRLYTLGEVEGRTYFTMEYVDGELLSQRIQKQGTLSWRESLAILKEVVAALNAAWSKKIIHRDIKPSNILLDRESHPHVADFGLAKPIDFKDETLSSEGIILGTPHYVSPEQALGQTVDFRSDIYSLGIVLFEMLTGNKPFQGTTPFAIISKQLNSPLPPLRESRPDVPENVQSLLKWMTEKKAEKRPESYEALLQRIDVILSEAETLRPGARPAIRLQLSRRKVAVVCAGILAFVLLVLVVRMFTLHGPPAPAQTLSATPALVVAVAPFYGPDEDSAKEGRVMASLIEKAIAQGLGNSGKVIGIDRTQEPVHDSQSARRLGEQWGSELVVWGEAFTLRKETEIQPYITVIPRKSPGREVTWQNASGVKDPMQSLAERPVASLVMTSEAPNQIELRKTSAAGIGEMVQLMAGVSALFVKENPEEALTLLRQIPASPDSLHYQARALLVLGKKDEALKLLDQAVLMNPNHSESLCLLGDLHLESGDLPEAFADYRMASQTGKAVRSTRGFLFRDRFFATETFVSRKYTGGHRLETAYLLSLEPDTRKVLDRVHLPGSVRSFLVANDRIRIFYTTAAGTEEDMEFDPQKSGRILGPGGDLSLRIQSIQSGEALAANFMNDLEAQEYVESAHFTSQPSALYEDAPKTLPELESALRDAISADSTQPWHLFFLGQALWSQNRVEDAESAWGELMAKPFPAVPYYEFAYMAGLFERLNQPVWADRAYSLALQRKSRTPPVPYSTLIERLVNANFIRPAAWASQKGIDLERQHLWLERARNISGICLEGDDFAAAAWSKYFHRKNLPEKAKQEKDIFRNAQRNPLNIVTTSTHLDYAFYVLIAAAISLPVLLLVMLFRAIRDRADSVPSSTRAQGTAPILLMLVGLVIGIVSWKQHWEQLMLFGSLILFLLIYLRSARVTFSGLVASIPANGRIALVVGVFFFLAALFCCMFLNLRLHVLLSRPLLIADSSDSTPVNPEAPAIANGSWTDWLTRIWSPGRALNIFTSDLELDTETGTEDFLSFFHQVALILILCLFISFLWVKPVARNSPDPVAPTGSTRRATRLLAYMVPGFSDMRWGSLLAGYAIFVLIVFALCCLAGWALVPHSFPVPGMITFLQMPNYFDSVPFPTPPGAGGGSVASYHYWTLFFAYADAPLFWGCAALAGACSLVLHFLRYRAMRRSDQGWTRS